MVSTRATGNPEAIATSNRPKSFKGGKSFRKASSSKKGAKTAPRNANKKTDRTYRNKIDHFVFEISPRVRSISLSSNAFDSEVEVETETSIEERSSPFFSRKALEREVAHLRRRIYESRRSRKSRSRSHRNRCKSIDSEKGSDERVSFL